jgi:hypothetical protein
MCNVSFLYVCVNQLCTIVHNVIKHTYITRPAEETLSITIMHVGSCVIRDSLSLFGVCTFPVHYYIPGKVPRQHLHDIAHM